MKKYIFTLFVFCCASLIFVSCGKKEILNVRGQVVSVDLVSDSINDDQVRFMSLSSNGDTLMFKMADVRYIDGLMFQGDSVSVDYIEGHNDTLHALILNVLHNNSHIIELGKAVGDTLVTRSLVPKQKPAAADSTSMIQSQK